MDYRKFQIEAHQLWAGESDWPGELAVLHLDSVRDYPEEVRLPACPIVGVGDSSHPLAPNMDALIEAPVSLELIVRQVLAHPRTAAVLVDLLRLLPRLQPQDGLTAESLAYAVLQGSEEHRQWLASNKSRRIMPMAPGRIEVARELGRLVVSLDNETQGNSIDRSMRDGLLEAFQLGALDREIERVSLRAKGRTFSLGAELGEFGTTSDPALAHAIRGRTLPARAALAIADRLDVHMQGACVGSGLELAAYAHRVTASPDAWFHLPELSMGILPGAGGCVSLVRRIGRQRTALMILSGKRLSVRQALAWGLIDEIVADAP